MKNIEQLIDENIDTYYQNHMCSKNESAVNLKPNLKMTKKEKIEQFKKQRRKTSSSMNIFANQ